MYPPTYRIVDEETRQTPAYIDAWDAEVVSAHGVELDLVDKTKHTVQPLGRIVTRPLTRPGQSARDQRMGVTMPENEGPNDHKAINGGPLRDHPAELHNLVRNSPTPKPRNRDYRN